MTRRPRDTDGSTVTGVARCGGIEDLLYAADARLSGTAHEIPPTT
ncbi:hypothetical protein ACF09G_03935 [Streptomyces albogriseolus]